MAGEELRIAERALAHREATHDEVVLLPMETAVPTSHGDMGNTLMPVQLLAHVCWLVLTFC